MTIFIDGRPYEADARQNLLHACLTLKLDLPYFCWHPAMGSVGACRQCAVKQFKDDQDTKGRIVMACMTPAGEGTRISINDPEARAFRAAVIEWLMLNHPHDCPVCDEGGECHLQDMTLMTGHTIRRTRFPKRTYRNQDLGPFINHEMNRCIQCYRCVRFYRDYAGGRDLNAFACHDSVYFGRHEDGPLENEFSGNLVEVCPTGVFTDKTLARHYTRKWDLQTAPSICTHCGLGCNTIPGERYGQLRRILNRYNNEINGYFLCDRGRFGYEFVNDSQRIRHPVLRSMASGSRETVSKSQTLERLAAWLAGGARVVGIGSPRASLEANFALRALVGPEHFFAGFSRTEARALARAIDLLRQAPAAPPSVKDAEQADAVLVLGEDVSDTAPRLALALRQAVRQQPMEAARALKIPFWHDAAVRDAVQDRKGPFYVATVGPTRLDDIATRTVHAAPADLARLGFEVARAFESPGDGLAGEIASALKSARRPLVVAGTSLGSEALLEAAAEIARALQAAPCFVVPECNSVGLALMEPRDLASALADLRRERADALIVLENDLHRRMDTRYAVELFDQADRIVAIDHLIHPTTLRADAVLPAAAFAEADGTLVNNEGRVQRFFQAFVPAGEIQESWRWLRDLAEATGRRAGAAWSRLDDVIAALVDAMPVFRPIRSAAPSAEFRQVDRKVPRQPGRYSGRTAMTAHVEISEPPPPDDPDAPFVFSMEGELGQAPAPLIPFFWSPGWNSAQSVHKFQSEADGPMRGPVPDARLIVPDPAATREPPRVPPPFQPREGEWLFVPVPLVFGTEELSVRAPAVARRSPRPHVVLRAEDAAGAETVEVRITEAVFRLPVEIRPGWPRGVAGLPVGLPGLIGVELPAWGTVRTL